jgi:hypothetical protein
MTMTKTRSLPMTRGRVTALVIGGPVALVLIGVVSLSIVAALAPVRVRVDRTVTLKGATAGVAVDNPDLTLNASHATGRQVLVRGTLTGAFTQPIVDLRTTVTGVAVHSHCVVPTGDCSGALDVTVPGSLPVLASDGTGNLNASGLHGQVTLSDGSGSLTAARLSGTISISDGAGDISATGLSGSSITISEQSGDLTATGVSGSTVGLSNSAGDITVSGLAATDMTGRDSAGNITVTFTAVPRRVDVVDSAGDITLILPRGPAYYQVSTQITNGSGSVSVRRSPSSPHVIDASTDSGNITIEY